MRRRRAKEQQPVQTPAITIRFYEEDAELLDWLKQFAGRHNMTSVIKLACYMLSGIQPEEGLLALLPEVQQTVQPPAQEMPVPAPREETSDALAAVMQELWALREELTQQRAHHSTPAPSGNGARSDTNHVPHHPTPPPSLPEESWPMDSPDPISVVSSGLDMSGPRRRRTPLPEPTIRSQPTEPVFDADDARRRLVASIHAYGKEFQKGR
jgi:hypothetical protein